MKLKLVDFLDLCCKSDLVEIYCQGVCILCSDVSLACEWYKSSDAVIDFIHVVNDVFYIEVRDGNYCD